MRFFENQILDGITLIIISTILLFLVGVYFDIIEYPPW